MGSGLLSASSLLSAPPLSETYANVPGSSRAERVARITYGEAFMKRFRTIIDGENHGRNRLMIEFFTSYPRFRGPLNQQLAKTHKPKKQSIAEPEDFILKERPHVDDRADAGEVVAIKRGYVSTLHCVEFEGDLWHLIIKYRGAALHAAFVADAAEAVRVSPSDIMNVSFSQRKCIILCDIYHAKSLDQEQVGCFLDMFSFPRVWKLYQSLQRLIQYRCADGDASAAHLEHLVHDVYAGEPDTPLAIRLQETASPATTTVSKNVHVLPQASLVRPTPSQSGRRRVAVPEIPLIHSQRVLFRGPHWQSVVAQQPKRLREALVRDGCRAAVMASAVSVVRMDATKTGLSVHLALTCPPHVTLADVTECVNDYNFPESWMVYDKQARGLLLTPSPSPESAATVSSAPTRSSATVASESLSASPSPAMNMFSAPRQSSTSVNSHQVHFDGARWADVLSDNAPIWRGAFRRDIAASLQCSPTEIVVEQHHLDDRGLMVTFSIMHASPECQTTDQLRPKLLHAAFTNMWGLYEVETPVAPKRQGYVSRQQVAAVELSDHGQESPIPAALSITSATMKEVTTLNTTDTVYLEGGNWDVVIVRCPEELHEAFASDVSAALELPPEALTAFKPLYAAGMLTSYTVAHPSTLTTRQVRDRIRSHALPRTWELYKEVSMFIASSEYGRQSMDSEGSLETRELIPSKESGPRSAEVQQLLSSALQLFDSVTSERHLVTHDLQEPPREGVQSTELAALHEQPLAWSTSNELDASLLTRSSWCGRTTTPEPSVVSRHLHTLEGDRWDDVIAMRNDELHAAFADDVAYACELPPTSVKNIHADFVDGLVMSYSVVHHPSLSEAAINAAVQASPMTCTWALYDTTGPCLTHRLEMKRTFPGDRWAVVLARIPNRVRSVFCEETSECLNVPIEHVELLDVTTGSLIVDFAVNFHEPRDVDKQRTKVTAFGYPRLMSLLHEPEYKHAPTAREPVLMGRQPWHIEQLPHGGQHLPSHHASLRESAEGPTSAQLARDPTMELSATHSSSQEPSSHQNDTISEAPPRREYGIRQPTQLAAPRNLSFSTSLSTTPTAVSGAFAEAGVQPRLAQHATPSEGLMHSVDSTLDTKEGRRMSAQRTSLGEPQTEFLFSVPVAIIHQSLGSRGPLRRAEEMRKPSATHSVNISQELENVMPSQSTVYPMGYEYDPRVESMSLRAAEEMLPQFSPRSAQCASEGLEYPMLSPSPSASIQKDTLFAEEVGRSVGAQQSIAVVRAAEADVVQRSAVPAASLHASVADLDVARSVHMVSLAEQHVNPSRVDTPTLAVSQTMPELGQLYGDRLNALRTHAGVVPIARAERGRRHPLAQRSGGVASTVLRASFAESGLRPNSAHLNKAHDTVLQSVESTVLGEHETTSLEQAADRRVSFGTPQRELLCTAPVSFIHQSVGGGSALRTAGEMHRPSAMHFLNLSAAMDHEMPSRYRYDPSLDSMSLHAAEEMVSQISPRSAQRASEGLEHPMLSPSPSTSIQKDTLFAEEVGRSVGAQQSIAVVRAAEADVVQRSAVPAASLHASVADLDVARSVHMVSLAEQHVNPSRVDTPTLAVSQTMPELGQLYGDRLNALRTHAGVVPIARAERGRRHPLAQRSGGVTSTVLRASFAESGLRPNSAHLNKAHDTVLQSVESIMRDSMETTQMSSLPERRMSLGAAQHVEVATTAVVPLLPSGKVARRLLATQKRQGRLSHASVSAASTPFRVSFGTHGSLPRSQERAVVQDAPLSSRISMFSSKETDAVEEQPTSRVGLGEPQEAFTCSAPVSIINQSVGSRSALRSAREVRKPSATHSVNISQGLENVMPSQSTVYPMGYEYDPRVESMSLHAAEEMLPQFSPRSAQCASEGLEHPMLSPSPSTSIQKDTLFAEEVGRSVGAQQSIELFRARSVSLPPTMVQPNLGHSVEEVQRGSAPMSVTLRRGDEVLMDSVVAESPSVLQVSFRESGIRPRSVHLNKAHDTVLQSVESTVLGEHETTSLEQAADRRVSFGTPQRELLCTAPVSFIHQSVGGGSALRMAGEMHRPSVMHSLNLSAAMDHEMPSRYRYDPSLDSMSLHAAEEMVSQISPRAAQRASEGLEEPMLSPSPSTSIQKDTLFAEEVGRSVGAQQSIELFRARSVPLPPTMAQPNLGHSMEEVQRGSAPKSLTFRRAEEVPMDSVASTALLMVEEAVEGHSLGSPRSIELAVLRPSALQMQAEDGDQVVHAHMMEFGNSPQPAVAARKKVSLVLQSPTSLQDRETSFSGAPLFRVQAEPVQEDRRVEIEVRQELTGIISQRGPLERSQHAEDAVDGTTQHSTYVARAMENEFRSKSSDYPMGYEYDPRMDRPLRSLGSPRGAALVEHTARPVAQQQREDRYDAVETAMMEASVEEPQTERTVTVARRRVEEIHSLTVSPSPKFSGFAGKPLFRVEEEDDLADRRGAPVEPTIRQEATRVISQRQVFGWSICAGESTGVRSSTTTSISHEDFLPMGYDVDLPFDRADRTRKLLSLSHYSRMRDGDRTGTASRSSFANKFSTMSMHGGAVQDSQADVPRSAVCHVPPENLLKASSSSSVTLNKRSLLGPGVLLSHSSVRDGLKGRSFERDETPELRAIRSVQDSSSSMEVLRYGGGRQMNMSGPRQDDNFLEIGKEPALVPSRGPRTGHSFLRMTGPRSMELTTASGVSLEARVSASASCYPMMYEMDSKFERQKEELVVSDSAVLDSPRTAFAHLLAAIQEEEEMAMQQLRGECPSLATGTPLQSSVASSVVVRAETAVLPTSWEDQIPAFATDHAVFLEGDEWGTVLLRAGDEGIIAAGSRDLSRAIGIEERLIKVEAPQVSSAGLYLHFQVHHGDQLTMEYVDDQVDQGTLSYLWSVYYQYALAPSASMRMMRPFQGGRWARLQQCDPDEVRRVFADETAALLGIPTDHVQVMDMTHDHHIDFAALFGEERQLAQQRVLIATFDYPMLHQLVAGARVETVGPKSSVLTAAQARASVPRFQGFEQSMMSQFSCPAPDIGTRREVWVHQPQWRPPLRFRTIVEPPTFVSEMRAEEKYALEPSVVMQEEHSVQSPMPLERELSHYGWMMHNLREDVMLARKAGILIAQPRGRAPLRFGRLMEPATSVIAMRADSQRSSLSSGIMRGYDALMNDPLVSEFSDCDFLIHNRRSDVLIAKSSGVPIAQPLGRPPLRFRTLMEPATQVMAMRAGSEIASIPSAIMKQYDALMNDPLVHEFSDCNFLIHNLPSDTIVAREAGILITQPLCRPPLRRSSFMEPATSIIAMRAGSQRSSLNSGIMRGYDALMNDPLVSEFSDCDFLIHNRRSDPIVLRRGASTIYQHSWRAQMRFRTLIEPPTSVVALRAESECVSLPSAVIHDYGKLMGDSLVREFSDCDWMVHNQRSDAMLAIKKIQPITQTLRRAPMRFRTLMESATLVAAMHAESEAASLHSACISDYGALMNDSLVHEFSDCEWLIHNVRADLYITQIPVVTIRQKMVQAPVKQSTWTADAVAPFGQRATPKVSCPISVVVVSQKPKRPPFRYHSMRGSEVGPVVAQKERQEERPLSGAEQWVEVAKHEASTRNSSSHSVYFDGPKWKSLLQKRRGEVESAFCRDIAAAVKVPLDNVMVDHAEYADGMLMSYTVLHPDSITPAMISECVSQSPMEDTWALYDGSRRSPPLESHSFRVQLHGSGWGEVLSNHAAELTAAFGEDVESILKVPASSLTDQKLSFRKGRLEIRFAAALPSSTRKSEASKQLEKATFAGTWELYRQLRQDERFMESTNQTQVKSRRGSASGLGRSQRIYHEDDLGIPTAVDALEAMAHESSDDERSGRSHGLLFEGAHWEEIILLHRDALRAAFVEDVAMSLGRPASAVHEVTLELVSGGMMARFMVHAHAKLPPSSVTERIHAYDFPRTWAFFQSCDRLSLPSASPMERTFKGDHWPRILRHHASAALRAFVEDTADCLGLLPTSVQVSRFAPRDNSVTVHFEVDLGHHSDSRSDPRLANTTLQDYPFPKLMTLYDDVKEAILQEGTSLRSSNDYSQPSEEEFLSQSVTVHSVFVQGPWLERANIMSHLDALRRAFGDDIATITELPLENMDWIEPVVFDDGMLLSYVVRHAAAVNTGAIDKLVDRSPLTSTWKLFDCLVGNHDMAPMQHFSSYSSARRESTSRMLATHPDSCCFTMHFDGAAWPALLEQQADEVRRRFEEDATTALAAHTGSDKNSNEAVALSVVPLTNGMFVHYAVPEWLGTSEADLDKKIAHYDFPLTWELFDSFSQEVDPVHSQYSPRLMEVESARKPLRAEQTTLAYDSTHMRKPTKHKDDKRRHDRSTEAHSNDSNNPQHANSIFINSAVLHDEPRFDARESKLVFYSVPEDLRQSPSPMSSSEGIDRRPSWISAKEMRSSESRYHAPTAVIPLLSQTISREQESTLGTSVSPSPANSTSHPYSQKLSSPSYAPDGLFRETWEINNAGGQSSSPTVNGFVVRPSDQLQLLLHRLTDVEEIMRQRYADYKGSLTSPK